MPKETRRTPSEDKYRITTDPLKSLDDNVDSRFKHWEQVEHEAQRLEKQLAELQCALDAIPNTPEGRPKRADVRVRMVDLKRELDRLMRYNDQVEFFSCLASVLKTEEGSVHESQEPAPSTEEVPYKSMSLLFSYVAPFSHTYTYIPQVRLSVTAPLKQRMRKKKNRARCSSVNMVTARSIVKLVGIKSGSKRKAVDCKRLGQLLREIPVDTAELEYCPSCPFKVALEHIEKPPSKCCPMCGLSTERIDETSSSVHDKDSAVHIPFTYRPKQHFYAWIKRVTGKLKFVIPQEVIDAVILELHNMRITDVNNVTWDIVNSILRDLAKKVDKKFSDYYQHVYQITNIIRGAPILTLTDVQEQELCNLFDVIFASWERHKEVTFTTTLTTNKKCLYASIRSSPTGTTFCPTLLSFSSASISSATRKRLCPCSTSLRDRKTSKSTIGSAN